MKQFIFIVIGCMTAVNLSAVQIIHRSSPYRSSEETRMLNQQEEQMQIMRENLEVQKKMLQETQNQNFRYNSRNGW